MEEFQNRYGINTSIYELCRFRNIKILEKFKEDDFNPLAHLPILYRMLVERVKSLEEFANASRNGRAFPKTRPKREKESRGYWTFKNTKELRNYKLNTDYYKISTLNESEEEENEEEDEEGEIVNEIKEEESDENEILHIKTKDKTIRYKYDKIKRKHKKKKKSKDGKDEEEE